MKRDGARPPLLVAVVAILCVVVAIGVALQGGFDFTGPRWTPGVPVAPVVHHTPQPEGAANTPAPPAHHAIGQGLTFSLLPIAIVLGALLIAVLALLTLYWLRHRRGASLRRLKVESTLGEEAVEAGEQSAADLPTLHRGLVRASETLETEREPRDAIVRAWIGLQEAAEDSGVRRRAAETPTEFTSRVFESVTADRTAATALLRVYLRVRFRREPATQADVLVARQAIDRLRETWPARTPE